MVQADYLALANDLEQAHALTSDLEIQLSGKSNELARFKAVWERTQADLAKLERDLDAMRKERHALANEAQRAYAFEHRYEKMKAAHDELLSRFATIEAELAAEKTAHTQARERLAAFIAKDHANNSAAGPLDAELRGGLEAVRDRIDQLLRRRAPAAETAARVSANVEKIDIQFDA